MISAQRLATLARAVDSHIDAFLGEVDEQSKGDSIGRSIPDATFIAWFQMMTMATYPPEPIVAPNGLVVTASPWLLNLPFVEGGDAELRRYEDLRGVDFNWVRQLAGLSPRVTRTVKYLQGQQMANTMPNRAPVQMPVQMGRAA